MANLSDAKKRDRQQVKSRARNRNRKAVLKTETRKLTDALHDGDVVKAEETFRTLARKLDQVASKGTLHKNTAARRKSRLAKRINAAKASKVVKSGK